MFAENAHSSSGGRKKHYVPIYSVPCAHRKKVQLRVAVNIKPYILKKKKGGKKKKGKKGVCDPHVQCHKKVKSPYRIWCELSNCAGCYKFAVTTTLLWCAGGLAPLTRPLRWYVIFCHLFIFFSYYHSVRSLWAFGSATCGVHCCYYG